MGFALHPVAGEKAGLKKYPGWLSRTRWGKFVYISILDTSVIDWLGKSDYFQNLS